MKDKLLSFEEARATLLAAVRPVTAIDEVDTGAALGRVLARGLRSAINQPAFDAAMMDGYAVRTADLTQAGQRLPVSQRIAAGSLGHRLAPGTVARIFTGAPLPDEADAVVMQELCELDGELVKFNTIPRPGEHVRRLGQEVKQGSEVLAAGCRLKPQQLALAAAVGAAQLPVLRRLRVALFSTGSELVMPGEPLPPGHIYNSNRFLLRALLQSLGCEVEDLGIIPDDLARTREVLRIAAEGRDLVLSSGGVSVGEEDHVKPAVEAEGRLELWKLAMKPGKPLAFGQVHGAAFIGLPGNPVSSLVTFLMLVRPFILASQGVTEVQPQAFMLPAAFDWPRPDRRREFLRVRVNEAGMLELYPDQGSAALPATVWASGLADIPPATVIERGQPLAYLPFSSLLD
ncbi:MAG: molybdopterin molybdotransferase MoeA [Thauera sp.]|nr:molybdopterin molybdotransferase MoeA [Thauera sp.]